MLIYVKPYTLDFNANCRCLCFDLFRKFTQNYLWWNSNPPITNSLRRRKTISDTRIGRLGVIVNFTIFSISFQIKTYQSLISQYFLKVFWNGCFPISYLLKWFICVYIVFWLILLEFRNKQFEINFLWISTLFFQFLFSVFERHLGRGVQNRRRENLGIAKIGLTPPLTPILALWWIWRQKRVNATRDILT